MSFWRKSLKRIRDKFLIAPWRAISTFAAASSYFLFALLIPLTTVICALLPFTPLTEQTLLEALDKWAPDYLYDFAAKIIEAVYVRADTAVPVSVIITLWTSSGVCAALMRGMDRAYGVERRENYILFRARACLYTLLLLPAILLSLAALALGDELLAMRDSFAGKSVFSIALSELFRYGAALVLLTLLFAALYKWMPAGKRKLRHQWAGAIFASISWSIFSAAFSVYVAISDKYGIYGFFGTILVAMLWTYYCMYFLLLGAYINRRG